jgi:hypothetical protein
MYRARDLSREVEGVRHEVRRVGVRQGFFEQEKSKFQIRTKWAVEIYILRL